MSESDHNRGYIVSISDHTLTLLSYPAKIKRPENAGTDGGYSGYERILLGITARAVQSMATLLASLPMSWAVP